MPKKLERIQSALPKIRNLSNPCRLCMHECKIDRKTNIGFCKSGLKPAVYSSSPHHGEEPPLSGTRGSGTIFFTHCNMRCIYCQNYSFSQEDDFEEIETSRLADRILELESMGCHNINFVSPTHYGCQIVEALLEASKQGLKIPVVYNTGGYDTEELIKLLDGIADVYLPDMRYFDNRMSLKYSSAPNYAGNNRKIIKEMYRQVGPLRVDKDGIAEKGVIIRLLILPKNVSGTVETLRFLSEEVSKDVYISVMSQYHPTYMARSHPDIAARITRKEYARVVDEVEKLGFTNGWIQGFKTETERFLGTNIKKGRFLWR